RQRARGPARARHRVVSAAATDGVPRMLLGGRRRVRAGRGAGVADRQALTVGIAGACRRGARSGIVVPGRQDACWRRPGAALPASFEGSAMYRKILVAFDGSPESRLAVDECAHLINVTGREIHLACVVHDPSPYLLAGEFVPEP